MGTGGLGAPVALYLAAMGVGEIGLVDFDTIEPSNLQRQIIHSLKDVGRHKVDSAYDRLMSINDLIKVTTHKFRLDESNIMDLISQYDVIIDGTDNFSSRYLINDACVLINRPYIYGSILSFSGQVSVLNYQGGPCYRCLFPEPPADELAPNCSANGVLGVVPGIIGTIQATEAVKVLLGIGLPLSGRLLVYDALKMVFRSISVNNHKACRVCSPQADINSLQEYDVVCAAMGNDGDDHLSPEVNITPKQVQKILTGNKNNIELIDLREPVETEICAIDGALNIPIGNLLNNLADMEKNKTYVLFCKTGERTNIGANAMHVNGFKNVHRMVGGIVRWSKDVDSNVLVY